MKDDDWYIKARITKKGLKVACQGGYLFKIDLIDAEGTQIEGTFYKESSEKFYPLLEEGKVYRITKGSVA
jgi:hypothetical protein